MLRLVTCFVTLFLVSFSQATYQLRWEKNIDGAKNSTYVLNEYWRHCNDYMMMSDSQFRKEMKDFYESEYPNAGANDIQGLLEFFGEDQVIESRAVCLSRIRPASIRNIDGMFQAFMSKARKYLQYEINQAVEEINAARAEQNHVKMTLSTGEFSKQDAERLNAFYEKLTNKLVKEEKEGVMDSLETVNKKLRWAYPVRTVQFKIQVEGA